jgi:hypothetical protein
MAKRSSDCHNVLQDLLMWIGCNDSVLDPTNFIIKDCASRPPIFIPTTDVDKSLGDSFEGQTHLMPMVVNGEDSDDQQAGFNECQLTG